jgi:hypothetical protein
VSVGRGAVCCQLRLRCARLLRCVSVYLTVGARACAAVVALAELVHLSLVRRPAAALLAAVGLTEITLCSSSSCQKD